MTFAITARCENTGMLGIAVCTAVPCVGGFTSFIQENVGAIVTMALCNPYLGIEGIKFLNSGKNASEAFEFLKSIDHEISKRQLAILDSKGNSYGYTGEHCFPYASQHVGKNFVVTANMMADETTVNAMAKSFENSRGDLAERLLLALEAGNATPGDKRGRQSASLLVYYKDSFPHRSIRVDEHKTPVEEIRRIFEIGKIQLFPFVSLMSNDEEIREKALKEVGGERLEILLKPVKER
jgi:uncharacterized Ntn-hydrolase superfamily protein